MKTDNTFRFTVHRAENPEVTDLEATVKDTGNVFDNASFLRAVNIFLTEIMKAGLVFQVELLGGEDNE